ncbi:TetR/AcrR family transcriptional regulator [Phytohabitans aurantiacus]|jgi:DNA-binding transcriptional regulator YbjK|uniref:TetR family transcriptional regulator n=1 Tax=Phytohabitans aurantiacus TaxID=3016789 RepID=A0ABQ5QZ64_9ACTN|nr:TetR/AcrR family transcriptional regulator [Phytohabitans aurantiacus]GLH99572.1 TetR family transcriptional regulator [Phytohabitans aurantiacus]
MRQNPGRRTALLDAAIEVLARDGSRGLTFRAVDAEAAVPNGTTSNYFANRDDLLNQVTQRTRERLTPNPSDVETTMREPHDHKLVTRLLYDLLDRMRRDRSSYLAMFELRLEATRRPEVRALLIDVFRANLQDGIDFHLGASLPGDEITVVLLYLAMSGLLIDDLTVPEVLAPYPYDQLIADMVERILPPAP